MLTDGRIHSKQGFNPSRMFTERVVSVVPYSTNSNDPTVNRTPQSPLITKHLRPRVKTTNYKTFGWNLREIKGIFAHLSTSPGLTCHLNTRQMAGSSDIWAVVHVASWYRAEFSGNSRGHVSLVRLFYYVIAWYSIRDESGMASGRRSANCPVLAQLADQLIVCLCFDGLDAFRSFGANRRVEQSSVGKWLKIKRIERAWWDDLRTVECCLWWRFVVQGDSMESRVVDCWCWALNNERRVNKHVCESLSVWSGIGDQGEEGYVPQCQIYQSIIGYGCNSVIVFSNGKDLGEHAHSGQRAVPGVLQTAGARSQSLAADGREESRGSGAQTTAAGPLLRCRVRGQCDQEHGGCQQEFQQYSGVAEERYFLQAAD